MAAVEIGSDLSDVQLWTVKDIKKSSGSSVKWRSHPLGNGPLHFVKH